MEQFTLSIGIWVERGESTELMDFLSLNALGAWKDQVEITECAPHEMLEAAKRAIASAGDPGRRALFYGQSGQIIKAIERLIDTPTQFIAIEGVKKGRARALKMLPQHLLIDQLSKLTDPFVDCDLEMYDPNLSGIRLTAWYMTPEIAAKWCRDVQPHIHALPSRVDRHWPWQSFQKNLHIDLMNWDSTMLPTFNEGLKTMVTGGKRIPFGVTIQNPKGVSHPLGMLSIIHHCNPLHQSDRDGELRPMYVSKLTAIPGHTEFRPPEIGSFRPTALVLEATRRICLKLQHGTAPGQVALDIPLLTLSAEPKGGQRLIDFYKNCGLEFVRDDDLLLPLTLKGRNLIGGTKAAMFRNRRSDWQPLNAGI